MREWLLTLLMIHFYGDDMLNEEGGVPGFIRAVNGCMSIFFHSSSLETALWRVGVYMREEIPSKGELGRWMVDT